MRGFLKDVAILEGRRDYTIDDLAFSTSIRHLHGVETYGIKFNIQGQVISFMVDTKYFPELIESYRGSDILIINVVRHTPHKNSRVMHLCIDDVKRILSMIKPRKAILTHFGMTMLRAQPWVLAKKLTEELGVEVIAASDGMKIEIP